MPTFLSWAGVKSSLKDLQLDGKDQSDALLKNKEVREDVLLELFTENESHDRSFSAAYRKGKYKLIQGNIKDPHWYYEPTADLLNSTDQSWVSYFVEMFMKWLEAIYETGPIDFVGDLVIVHIVYYKNMYFDDDKGDRLYDLEADPEERNNIAKDHPNIVADFSKTLNVMQKKRPRHPKYWFVHGDFGKDSELAGDCSGSLVSSEHCKFTHPWIPDTIDVADEENLDLIPGLEWYIGELVRSNWKRLTIFVSATILIPILLCLKCHN